MSTPLLLSPQATAAALPYPALAREIEALLRDPSVVVPPRLVQPLPGGGSLFVMPALDAQLAITKLITFVAGNAAQGLPTIQGDIVVFDARRGQRLVVLDGPTVTARRTAAVSLLAAQRLAPQARGPLLIVGAGVQGRIAVIVQARTLRCDTRLRRQWFRKCSMIAVSRLEHPVIFCSPRRSLRSGAGCRPALSARGRP